MALSAGARLGNFEIVGTLGAGGMGVVYRARDLKLRRDVALKILPDVFAADPDRLKRFQREARAIAALNHPNVVTIHSVEEVDGIHFLTMELIDGQTLVRLIPPGGLAMRRLLEIALPLTDAVSAAHERGIVHRDLKPANVMVGHGSRVKVLDFGLAKLREEPETRLTAHATTEYVTSVHDVVGTPAYMSPEQAEGKQVDTRSDVFSLGVMLFEMATGTRPFTGDSPFAIASSILRDPPPALAPLRPDLPADFERIVRRCLAKDPNGRYQTALEVRNELQYLNPQSAVTTVPFRRGVSPARTIVASAVAGVVLVAVTLAVIWRPFGPDRDARPMRPTFRQLTSQSGKETFPHLSPDGRWIVYTGEEDGDRDVYLQSTSGQTPINLTADSAADDEQPAFSPDGERIAFRSSRDGGGIFVMGRTGEGVRRVTAEGFNPAWSPDGTQLAYTTVRTEFRPQNAEQRGALMIAAVGGGSVPVRLHDSAMMPSWSPRGLRIAFSTGIGSGEGTSNIVTLSVGPGESARVEPVTKDAFLNWNPVWAPDGRYLYFVSNRGGSMNIWRVAVDEASGRPQGEPEPMTTPAPFASHLSISADGTRLAYSAVLETQNIQRLGLDPIKGAVVGAPTGVTTGSRFWANPDPSPDGSMVAFYSQIGPEGDLYVARSDGAGGIRQLTDDAAIDRVPRWSPDGKAIVAFSDRSGELQVWHIRPDGSDLRQLTHTPSSIAAWSPDGRRLAVARQQTERGRPTATIIDPYGAPEADVLDLPAPPAPHTQFAPNSWSPDGRHLAGQNGFTTPGISIYSLDTRSFQRVTEFGEWPVWLPDNQRILFVSRGREFHLLDTRTRSTQVIFSVSRDTLGPPRLTRDGRDMYFSRRVTEADIWTATLPPWK